MNILVADVIRATSQATGILETELLSPRHLKPLSIARQAAMFVARKRTTHSLPQIGRAFGGRDHSTILYGIRAAEKRIRDDPDFADLVRRIDANFGEAVVVSISFERLMAFRSTRFQTA